MVRNFCRISLPYIFNVKTVTFFNEKPTEGANGRVRTFAAAFSADNALLLTSLESSRMADTNGIRVSVWSLAFGDLLFT